MDRKITHLDRWTEVATSAALGNSKAFLVLMDRFGRDGALERTRVARAVIHQMREDEAR